MSRTEAIEMACGVTAIICALLWPSILMALVAIIHLIVG